MCDLCAIKDCTLTTYFKIVMCDTCNVPMVVLKRHSSTLNLLEGRELLVIWGESFPEKQLRTQARQFPDHWHAHMETAG